MNDAYFDADSCRLEDLVALTEQDNPAPAHACDVQKRVPVYDMAALAPRLADPAARRVLMAEWAVVLRHGAGVIVLRKACTDLAAIDAATEIYEAIIAREKAQGGGADHFSAGTNDRVWNSLQKLCAADPSVFARYFACPAIDAACEAWLGPNYQMTAQVNLVHPGGAAQQAHRDYHLGFQTAEISANYPAHVHDLSPVLTLQGAVAHCDMPLESGPTKLLPYSQAYRPGYAAWRRPDFRDYFEKTCIQLPLDKGDAVFFNPALFHAAGANTSKAIHRMANLLQVSSAFGRAMEVIDRETMCRQLYPVLRGADLPPLALKAVLAASAEGYSFPTNLDLDPPVGGLAPQTQQALMAQALAENWEVSDFEAALRAQSGRRLA